jgi:hypothetical protein
MLSSGSTLSRHSSVESWLKDPNDDLDPAGRHPVFQFELSCAYVCPCLGVCVVCMFVFVCMLVRVYMCVCVYECVHTFVYVYCVSQSARCVCSLVLYSMLY